LLGATRGEERSHHDPDAVAGDGCEITAGLGTEEKDHEDGEEEVLDIERNEALEEEPIERRCCCDEQKSDATGVGGEGDAGGAEDREADTESEGGPGEAIGNGDQQEGADDEEVDGEFLDARERVGGLERYGTRIAGVLPWRSKT
jgi:hypothetical protein